MSEHDRIRLLWPDHLGLARGKYLPIRHAERGANHCVATFALGYDRSLIPAPGSYLLEGLPDVHAAYDPADVRPGWEDDRTGVAVGHLTLDGEPYTYSARYALQQAIAAWQQRGLTPKVGIELEAYVLQPDGDGGWERWATPRSMVYGTGPGSDPVGLIDDIFRAAERCGFRIESLNTEFDESQFELTLEYDDALRAADDAFLFRVLAREVALSKGLDLTFLGKPFSGISGSGVHVNTSMVDAAGQNQLADPSSTDGLSELAHQMIGGLLAHHRGLAALCAPTVNAYRRLRPGELAGYWANWGHEHRMTTCRVPSARGSATRVEHRMSDGAANVHLAVAAVLSAARLGVEAGLDPGEPFTGDGFEEVGTDVCVAADLSTALDDLEADTALVEAVGADVCANLIANKRAEWERYLDESGDHDPDGPVTPWELSQYLMYH